MKRLIKYRVWDIDEKHFVEPSWRFHLESDGSFHTNIRGTDEYKEQRDEFFIVQLFTGILDKNGVEIYEGDLVKFTFMHGEGDSETTTGEVYFEDGIFFFDRKLEFATNDCNFRKESLEVVGNIFENPLTQSEK